MLSSLGEYVGSKTHARTGSKCHIVEKQKEQPSHVRFALDAIGVLCLCKHPCLGVANKEKGGSRVPEDLDLRDP